MEGKKDSFQVAFGLVAFGSGANLTDGFSQYGELKARLVKWDPEGTYFEDLETHPCSEAELGLTEDQD